MAWALFCERRPSSSCITIAEREKLEAEFYIPDSTLIGLWYVRCGDPPPPAISPRHIQRGRCWAAKDCLPSCRPFPKLEGRHRPVSNEKENHWVQLGFEFQARRHQSLFVRLPDDTLTHHKPSLNWFILWTKLMISGFVSVCTMAWSRSYHHQCPPNGRHCPLSECCCDPWSPLTILGMPTMRSELERHNDIREILDSSNAVSQTLVNTNSGDTT